MPTSRTFDHADYVNAPIKYQLFKTAKVRNHVLTHNGESDLEAGACVGLEYAGIVRNQLYRRDEPIYHIKGTEHTLYASNLTDFCL
jgi:hypothetical protein